TTVGDCPAVIGVAANGTNLCFDQMSKKGSCAGDAGGPSLAQVQGTTTVVGVHAYGDQNCSQFTVDARVAAETSFIGARLCVADGYCAPSCGLAGLPADPDCAVAVDGGVDATGFDASGGTGGSPGGAGGTGGAAG